MFQEVGIGLFALPFTENENQRLGLSELSGHLVHLLDHQIRGGAVFAHQIALSHVFTGRSRKLADAVEFGGSIFTVFIYKVELIFPQHFHAQ